MSGSFLRLGELRLQLHDHQRRLLITADQKRADVFVGEGADIGDDRIAVAGVLGRVWHSGKLRKFGNELVVDERLVIVGESFGRILPMRHDDDAALEQVALEGEFLNSFSA